MKKISLFAFTLMASGLSFAYTGNSDYEDCIARQEIASLTLQQEIQKKFKEKIYQCRDTNAPEECIIRATQAKNEALETTEKVYEQRKKACLKYPWLD